MTSRHLLLASLLAAAALTSACNDNNSPQTPVVITNPTPPPGPPAPPPAPRSVSISQFLSELMAMVTGASCNTALPALLESVNLTDDMTEVDANTLSVNCAS